MTLYRAVSEAEWRDLDQTGALRGALNAIEYGKWFAVTASDAKRWGTWFESIGEGPHHWIVIIEIDNSTLADCIRRSLQDGIGPAVFVPRELLGRVTIVSP